jgi:opacity protein-like surface antigen
MIQSAGNSGQPRDLHESAIGIEFFYPALHTSNSKSKTLKRKLMKNLALLSATSALMFATGSLQANEWFDSPEKPLYVQALGGLNFLEAKCGYGSRLSTKVGYVVSGSIGYELSNGLRAEAEVAFRRNTADTIHFFGGNYPIDMHYQTTSYMGNLLWDISLCRFGLNIERYRPFIGAGIGCDQQYYETNDFHGCVRAKNAIFAWQVMAGISYELYENWNLSLGYNFHKPGTTGVYNQAVTLAVKHNFCL